MGTIPYGVGMVHNSMTSVSTITLLHIIIYLFIGVWPTGNRCARDPDIGFRPAYYASRIVLKKFHKYYWEQFVCTI